jgi:hypothetical protein
MTVLGHAGVADRPAVRDIARASLPVQCPLARPGTKRNPTARNEQFSARAGQLRLPVVFETSSIPLDANLG